MPSIAEAPSLPPDAGGSESEPGESKLLTYSLEMAPEDLRSMERNAFSNQTYPGTFTFNGEVYQGVKVRYRGAWARSWPKKPLKIFFTKEKPFQGQHCLNLNSAWRDPAMVRESLAYHIYSASGAPAPQARLVRLNLNGKFRGVYVQVEQPDQSFVQRLNLKGASAYKADSRSNQADERDLGSEQSFQRHYEKQTKKKESYAALQEFCRDLAQAPGTADFFNRQVDIERYVNYLAATALVQNWDGFNKNHYLIYDGEGSRKWLVVPWDLDRTLGDHWDWSFDEARLPLMLGTRRLPGVTGWNRLQDRFLSHPEFRQRFVSRVAELLEKEFTPDRLYPVLDQLEAELGSDAALDRRRWPTQHGDVAAGIAQVKEFIQQRRAFLLAEIQKHQGE